MAGFVRNHVRKASDERSIIHLDKNLTPTVLAESILGLVGSALVIVEILSGHEDSAGLRKTSRLHHRSTLPSRQYGYKLPSSMYPILRCTSTIHHSPRANIAGSSRILFTELMRAYLVSGYLPSNSLTTTVKLFGLPYIWTT